MTKEIWLPMVGYEGYYIISSLGRIKLLDREGYRKNGKFFKVHSKVKEPYTTNFGYKRVHLEKNKKSKHVLVHRLVAEAFIPNPDNKPYINHKNGVRTDNRVENLEWCTASENLLHSYKVLGRKAPHRFGIDNPMTKIVLKIKDGVIVGEFLGLKEAAKNIGARADTIQKVCAGKYKTCKGFAWKYKQKRI